MSSPDTSANDRCESLYSLAHLTLMGCTIPELVYIAARTGYDAVSPRLIPSGVPEESAVPPLGLDAMRAARSALSLTGIQVHDIEIARITPHTRLSEFEPALEVGAELDAKRLLSSVWLDAAQEFETSAIVDEFAALCALADQYGMSVALEFPTFSRISRLHQAAEVLRGANQANGEILIDTLYWQFSRAYLSELELLPSDWFSYIQICDVSPGIPDTTEGMLHIARHARLYPGDGCIDFKSIIERLPPVNYSIELPNLSRVEELGYEMHARRCLEAAKGTLGSMHSKRSHDTPVNFEKEEKANGSRVH